MFDMGPYYLTALLNLFGPVKRITGMASIAIPERTITSQPKAGHEDQACETPDHVVGLMEFANGCRRHDRAELRRHRRRVRRRHTRSWSTAPTACHPRARPQRVRRHRPRPPPRRAGRDARCRPLFVTGYGRSVGLADMAVAIRTGRPHRCDGLQALAVLDLMQGFLDSSATGVAHRPVVRVHAAGRRCRPTLPFGQFDA